MTDQELKNLIASIAIRQEKLTESQEQTEKEIQELRKAQAETSRQIGGLNNGFGRFAEGLAYPAIEKMLYEDFNLENVIAGEFKRKGSDLQIDVLGYTNSTQNKVFVVEVKTYLEARAIKQLQNTLQRFPEFFPEHKDKKLFGMIAAVNIPKGTREKVLKEGLYLAHIHNDTVTLQTPENFKPKVF